MSKELTVFLDSDVLLSSVISQRGAAYLLFQQVNLVRYVSNYSTLEATRVTKELNLSINALKNRVGNCKQVKLASTLDKIKREYSKYVHDENDTHIVAGARECSARFLITYNLKDYSSELILKDFKIIVLTPGMFLQYLRSRS